MKSPEIFTRGSSAVTKSFGEKSEFGISTSNLAILCYHAYSAMCMQCRFSGGGTGPADPAVAGPIISWTSNLLDNCC